IYKIRIRVKRENRPLFCASSKNKCRYMLQCHLKVQQGLSFCWTVEDCEYWSLNTTERVACVYDGCSVFKGLEKRRPRDFFPFEIKMHGIWAYPRYYTTRKPREVSDPHNLAL